jgi:hypothetical protein
MCLICDRLKNNQMTLNEARKNVMELRILDHVDADHYVEIIAAISELQKTEDEKKIESFFNK